MWAKIAALYGRNGVKNNVLKYRDSSVASLSFYTILQEAHPLCVFLQEVAPRSSSKHQDSTHQNRRDAAGVLLDHTRMSPLLLLLLLLLFSSLLFSFSFRFFHPYRPDLNLSPPFPSFQRSCRPSRKTKPERPPPKLRASLPDRRRKLLNPKPKRRSRRGSVGMRVMRREVEVSESVRLEVETVGGMEEREGGRQG
jgi:hypothetical protein